MTEKLNLNYHFKTLNSVYVPEKWLDFRQKYYRKK